MDNARSRRGKRVAIAGVLLCLGVLAAAGFAAKDGIIEEWCILRLSSEDPAVRNAAALRLGQMRSAKAVPRLIELAAAHARSDPKEELNLRASLGAEFFAVSLSGCDALVAIGAPAVPGLTHALDRTDRTSQAIALWVLHAIGPEAHEAAPSVIGLLHGDPYADAAAAVWTILRRIGPGAGPALIAALGDPSNVRLVPHLSRTILDMDPPVAPEIKDEAVTALGKLLEGNEPRARAAAIECLREFGAPAQTAIPKLIVLLGDPDPGVSAEVALTLGRIGPSAVTALLQALQRRSFADPQPAYTAIIVIHKDHGGVVPALIPGLEDADERFAVECATLLGAISAIGPPAREAIPALTAAAEEGTPALKRAAEQALAVMEP